MFLNLPQLAWSLEPLRIEPVVNGHFPVPRQLRQANYSVAALRYWFNYHFLLAENSNKSVLDICELKSGRGEQLEFINTSVSAGHPRIIFRRWDAFASEFPDQSPGMQAHGVAKRVQYDVIILPRSRLDWATLERQLIRLIPRLRHNGIFLGATRLMNKPGRTDGSKNGSKNGSKDGNSTKGKSTKVKTGEKHVFRQKNLNALARKFALSVDYVSGAYFRRHAGLVPCQHAKRFRLNLMLGALIPALAGEVYWVLRK